MEGRSGNGKWVAAVAGGWLAWKVAPQQVRDGIIEVVGQILENSARQREWLPNPTPPALPPPSTPPPRDPRTPLSDLLRPDDWKQELLASLMSNAPPAGTQPPAKPVVADPSDGRWKSVLVHPSVVLVLGKRGSGKSALAYRLLELFRYQAAPYVVGVPSNARRLLPNWIGIAATLDDLPHDAIAIVDEAYIRFHARASMAAQSRAMSGIVNLSRQREQTLIFVTQEARQVDRNIASSASAVLLKEPSSLQLEFDRPELRRLVGQAQDQFGIVRGDKRRWTYVHAPDADFAGMLENELPTFWKPSLSTLFAVGEGTAKPRQAKRPSSGERAARAKDLRDRGWSLGQIAKDIGVSKATVVNYLRDYPYQR